MEKEKEKEKGKNEMTNIRRAHQSCWVKLLEEEGLYQPLDAGSTTPGWHFFVYPI